jgi:hypothetical protein
MKINDLFTGFVPSLNEIFDTKIPVENWMTSKSGARIGKLEVDEDLYLIELTPHTYDFQTTTYKFINVSFKKIINGKESEDLTFTNKTGSKVIGSIVHGVIDELKNFDADAIVFIATDHIEQRMRIYNRLFSNLGGLINSEFSGSIKDIKIPNGNMSIILNKRISNEDVNSFVEYLKTVNK